MKYASSLDKLAKGLTAGVTIIFIATIITEVIAVKYIGTLEVASTAVALMVSWLACFAFKPSGYDVLDGKLIINRPLKNVIIDKHDIASAEMLDGKSLRGSIRLFGVGGLFGYFGKYVNSKLGRMTWYATRRDKIVLITTKDNKKIIVTPDEPSAFVAAIK
ncbi:MAG: PH domain-containing protein [Chitinophagaceae bacterium]